MRPREESATHKRAVPKYPSLRFQRTQTIRIWRRVWQRGMDAHIPKPFRWEQLEAAMLKVLENHQKTSSHVKPALQAIDPQPSSTWFDTAQLMQLYAQDLILARSVVSGFLMENTDSLQKLAMETEAENEPGLRQAAHLVKGACAYACATALEQDMIMLSDAAKQGDWHACRQRLSLVSLHEKETSVAMHAWLKDTHPEPENMI